MRKIGLVVLLCVMASSGFANPSFYCKGTKRFVVNQSGLNCDLKGEIVSTSSLKMPLVKELTFGSDIRISATKSNVFKLLKQGNYQDELVAQLPKLKFNGTLKLSCETSTLSFSFYLAPKLTLKGNDLCKSSLRIKEVSLGLSGFSISRVSAVFDRLVQNFLKKSKRVKYEAKKLAQKSLPAVQKYIGCP